jgi:hypothetical protein
VENIIIPTKMDLQHTTRVKGSMILSWNSRLGIWGPFIVSSLATWLANRTMWWSPYYENILVALGLLSLAFATRVLLNSGFRVWSVVGVLLGLLIGQLWFFKDVYTFAIWSLVGFAP